MKKFLEARLGPHWLNAYVMTILVGVWLGVLVMTLMVTGRLRVKGYWRTFRLLWQGRVIVAANHPEGSTPFTMTGTLFPLYAFCPWLYFWNMPRDGLVPKPFLAPLRCILVERGDSKEKSAALRTAVKLLKALANFLLFPEGTRTYDEKNPSVELVEWMGRRIRPIKDTAVPYIAVMSGATIIPTYIDSPGIDRKLYFWASIMHVMRRGMTIHFGEPYRVEREGFNLADENRRLEQAILHA